MDRTGPHRSKQPELVRQRLLDAGVQMLAEGRALSIGGVAEGAGVTKGAVQHHFGTREALLLAIFDTLVQAFDQRLQDPRGRDSAAWRYAQATLENPRDEAAARDWRALLVAAVVEPAMARRWADWARAEREKDFARQPRARRVDARAIGQLLARLAADGLWLAEALGTYTLSPAERRGLTAALKKLTQPTAEEE